MSGLDFFARPALPSLQLHIDWATELVRTRFGLGASAEPLGSQQDANFLLRAPDGAPVAVLKIANPAFSIDEVAAQDAAADLLATACPDLRSATVLRGGGGEPLRAVVETGAGPGVARVLRFLDGGTPACRGYLSPALVTGMGELAGRVDRALAGFEHPGLDRVLQWDLRHAERTCELLLEYVPAARRQDVTAAVRTAWAAVAAVADELPQQAVHLDLTDDNMMLRSVDAATGVDGVIDFGDLTRSWTVSELAILLSSLLHHAGAEPASVLPAVRGYHAVRPLSEPEADALWPLVVLRGAVLVVSSCQQLALDGGANSYTADRIDSEWQVLEQALSVPTHVMTALVRDAVGRPVRPVPLPDGSLVDAAGAEVLSLGWESPDLDDGAWEQDGLVDRLAGERLDGGAAAVVTRYGEARLAGSPGPAHQAPATVATGRTVWFAEPAVLRAPWPGTVRRTATGLALDDGTWTLTIDGVTGDPEDGTQVQAGDVLARPAARAGVHLAVNLAVNLAVHRGGPAPALVRPEYAAGWLAGCTDPGALLGLPVAADGSAAALLDRRAASLADVQEHYYDAPPRVERGWRHHLVTAHGRVLLDMINNVTSVGHSHPRIAATATRQLHLLNTNSRFHYEAIVEFSERLAALLPDPLDTVFLVNSGSEAVDLALRLAMVSTGRPDVVGVREAYHGWTFASDAVSTSVADNPNALHTRPAWVHTVDAPNPYRGIHRGAEAARYGPEAAHAIDSLALSGRPPAAFIGEAFYGNAGGMPLPEGYLGHVYAAVRRNGGLAIADEIQVGYGRLGDWFWGFEQQGVVPDVVTVAKSVGNGFPVGAVITSRAVAARYRAAGYFFSSTGGSPLSSRIGLTVLDIIEQEGLQENARVVGAHLKQRLVDLGARHRLIGAVHGNGLYLGVEFVRNHDTLEPAAEETAAICDRMLQLGVVIQPTSDRMNVLKVKPPLCLDTGSADYFADTLDRVLTEGW